MNVERLRTYALRLYESAKLRNDTTETVIATQQQQLRQLECMHRETTRQYNDAVSQLQSVQLALTKMTEGTGNERRDRTMTLSLHRAILTYVEGDARSYFITVYDDLIAAVEANATARNHTLPCRHWLDADSISQFNTIHASSGQLYMRKNRLSYVRYITPAIQQMYKADFDAVFTRRHEALTEFCGTTHVHRVNRVRHFVIIVARVQFEREFLRCSVRNIDDLSVQASHLCQYGPCVRFSHIIMESWRMNLDRTNCVGPTDTAVGSVVGLRSTCVHHPPCLWRGWRARPATTP